MAPVGPSVRDWSVDARAQDSRRGARRIDRNTSYFKFLYDYLKAGTEGMIHPSAITKCVRVVKKLVRQRIVSIGLPGERHPGGASSCTCCKAVDTSVPLGPPREEDVSVTDSVGPRTLTSTSFSGAWRGFSCSTVPRARLSCSR